MTVPPATGPSRPAPPPLRLPRPSRRPGGFIASLLLHGIILLLIGRFGVQWVLGGGDERFGPRGGGGGAGGSVRLVDLPAAAAPAPAAPVQQPVVHTVPPPQPDPAITLPPPTLKPLSMTVAPALASVATANGTAGQGPGTGGGTGAGLGPGVGNDSGPGRGGNGGVASIPYARTLLVPPRCVHGDFTLRFWVEADGSVSKMSVEPQLKDGACRGEVLDKMKGFQFLPARTRDGRAVPAVFTMTMHQ